MRKHRPEETENCSLRKPEVSVAVQCLFNIATFRHKTLRPFQRQDFFHGSSYTCSNAKVKLPPFMPQALFPIFLDCVCTRDAEPVEHGFAEVSRFFESSQVAAPEGRSH